MYRFLESICFKGGAYQLLELHQQRVNQTFIRFFPQHQPIELRKVLPEVAGVQRSKVRLEYEAKKWDIQVNEYSIKRIETLKVISTEEIDYRFKYADRGLLNQLFAQRSGAEDILIAKNGKLTDSYYANVILKKENEWVTPKSCLLKGVKRQWLLNQHIIKEEDIDIRQLKNYSEISLINAMLDPGEVTIPISKVLID